MYLLTVMQSDLTNEVTEFNFLFSSSPFRLMFGAFMAAMLVLIIMSLRTNNAYNKLLSSSDEKQKGQLKLITDLSNVLFALKDLYTELDHRAEDDYQGITAYLERAIDKLDGLKDSDLDATTAQAEIALEVANLHAETRHYLQERIHLELVDLVERIYRQRASALVGQVFNFPDSFDCRWTLALVKSSLPGRAVTLYSAPILSDNTAIGQLESEGRVAYIIEHSIISGWLCIWDKLADPQLKAWVQSPYVNFEKLPSKGVESEIQT